jgi:hypothetical protein
MPRGEQSDLWKVFCRLTAYAKANLRFREPMVMLRGFLIIGFGQHGLGLLLELPRADNDSSKQGG